MAVNAIEKQKRVKRNYLAYKEILESGYDKKLLWRANLYIDEGAEDWNDLHPWNAPPAPGVAAAGENPSWWSESWGYNEWNRDFSMNSPFNNDASVGLSNLSPGNGKQVVKLPSFTPVRTLKTDQNAVTAENVIRGSVAYSYPKHRYETIATWDTPQVASEGAPNGVPSYNDKTGFPGSMDSPFDFVWKMRKQRAALNNEPSSGEAPGNSWWNYNVERPAADGTNFSASLADGSKVFQHIKYVPSLGLYLYSRFLAENKKDSDTSEADLWTATGVLPTEFKRRNASWIIEAGTDCVGFAQKAASYSGRTYSWVPLPDGPMEGSGEEDIYKVLDRYHEQTAPIAYRQYPRPQNGAQLGSTIIHNSPPGEGNGDGYYQTKDIDGNDFTNDEKQAALSALRRIIPGDIWMKDSPDGVEFDPVDSLWNNHIAIVASVPDNPEAITDPQEYMNQIILIEGEFTNKIQSVIKKLSVGDYNRNNVNESIQIYSSFLLKPDTLPATTGLNCQSWAIRRLK